MTKYTRQDKSIEMEKPSYESNNENSNNDDDENTNKSRIVSQSIYR